MHILGNRLENLSGKSGLKFETIHHIVYVIHEKRYKAILDKGQSRVFTAHTECEGCDGSSLVTECNLLSPWFITV